MDNIFLQTKMSARAVGIKQYTPAYSIATRAGVLYL